MSAEIQTAAPKPLLTAFLRTAWFLGRVWRLLFGLLLCLAPVTAVLVVGWSYRLQQRMVMRQWFLRRGAGAEGIPTAHFSVFVREDERLAGFADWPNWIIGRASPRREPAGRRERVMNFFADLFWRASGSLWINLRLGMQALLSVWAVTLPIGLIWLLAWWSGWQNSFTKGYEQAWVGPVLGLSAIGVFVIVMIYVPMAQARHAATGDWRTFFQLRPIRLLIAERRAAYLGLTALIAVFWVVLGGMRALPMIFPHIISGFEDMSRARALQAGEPFYLMATAACFVAILAARAVAARVYAGAVLSALGAGRLAMSELAPAERVMLTRLNLLNGAPDVKERPNGRLRRLGRRLLEALVVIAVPAIWIAVAVSIFVAQFLHYDWAGWLNHPIIHLPWLHRP
jgi:hypothetical protein